MTEEDQISRAPVDPQRAYLEQLQTEAQLLSGVERAEHEWMISELMGELALSESVQQQAMDDIDRAKKMALTGKVSAEPEHRMTFPLDMSQIGWVSSRDVEPIPVNEVASTEQKFYIGSIIDRDKVTKKSFERLERQGIAEKLVEDVKEVGLPKLWQELKSGKGKLRPISVGSMQTSKVHNHKSLNTSYPAYKIDVQGTNNRAIVLVAGKIDGEPVFVLTALFDHEDTHKLIPHMSIKKYKHKN